MILDNSYIVKSGSFSISDYTIKISQKQRKLELDAHFEVLGDFSLPPKTLYVRYSLPNQQVDLNFLSLNSNKSCYPKYTTNLSCYVYENVADLSTELDKTLKEDISQAKPFDLTVSFDIDKSKLEVLENVKKPKPYTNATYYSFIENVSKEKLAISFEYQNTYEFVREKGNESYGSLELFDYVYIKKGKTNFYHKIFLPVFAYKYDDITTDPIRDWFIIGNKSTHFYLDKTFSIHQPNFGIDVVYENNRYYLPINSKTKWEDVNYRDAKKLVSMSSYVFSEANKSWHETFDDQRGLYLNKNSHGYLKAELDLFIKNRYYRLKLKNFFNFVKWQKEEPGYFMFVRNDEYFSKDRFTDMVHTLDF